MSKKCLNESSIVVIGFHESLNKVAQEGQMDISVRFCIDDGGLHNFKTVTWRHFSSALWGHATASDLLNSFLIVHSYKGYGTQKDIAKNLHGWAEYKILIFSLLNLFNAKDVLRRPSPTHGKRKTSSCKASHYVFSLSALL